MKRVASDRERTCRMCNRVHNTPQRARECCRGTGPAGREVTQRALRRQKRYRRSQRDRLALKESET